MPAPFGNGGLQAAEAPSVGEVLIGSYAFTINTSFEPYRRDAFRHRTIPSQRESVNLEGKTGEGTVNTEGFWRVQAFDWSYGAGQLYADREGSVANRFLESRGMDVFRYPYELRLLNDVTNAYPDTGYSFEVQSVQVLGIANFLFLYRSNRNIVYSSNGSSWTDAGFTSASGTASSRKPMATDGTNVYVADNNGVYYATVTNSGPGAWTQWITGSAVGMLAVCSGRVLVSSGPALYDITGVANGTALSSLTPLYTHPNPNWGWWDADAGASNIYIAGFVSTGGIQGTRTAIYRVTIEPDGTNLQIPVVALPLPANEVCYTVYSYLNYTFLGTTSGVRMCRTVNANDPTGDTGDLISGPVMPNLTHQMNPTLNLQLFVGGITASDRFVYFGWSNFANDHTGLGVLDISHMVGDLEPAYASHLMAPNPQDDTAGLITSVGWDPINNFPCFTTSYQGLYMVDPANLVKNGWLETGRVTFGIPDDKIACQMCVQQLPPVVAPTKTGSAANNAIFCHLTSDLVAGTTYGSIPVSTTGHGILAGDFVTVTNGVDADVFTCSATAGIGATSIPVDPQPAQASYTANLSTVQALGVEAGTNFVGANYLDPNNDLNSTLVAGTATLYGSSFTPYQPKMIGALIGVDDWGFVQGSPILDPTILPTELPRLLNPLIRAAEFNVRLWMTRFSTTYIGPRISRWVLKALPAVVSGTTISPVLNLHGVMDGEGTGRTIDPYAAYSYLENLRLSQTPFTYTEGSYSATCVVQEVDWLPFNRRDTSDFGFQGDLIVYLKTLVG